MADMINKFLDLEGLKKVWGQNINITPKDVKVQLNGKVTTGTYVAGSDGKTGPTASTINLGTVVVGATANGGLKLSDKDTKLGLNVQFKEVDNTIQLQDANGTKLAEFNTSKFTKDSFLKRVEYVEVDGEGAVTNGVKDIPAEATKAIPTKPGKYLYFEWNLAPSEGGQDVQYDWISVDTLVNDYTAGKGIKIGSDHKIDVVLGVDKGLKFNPNTDGGSIEVTPGAGITVDSEGVRIADTTLESINTALHSDDVSVTAGDNNKYITVGTTILGTNKYIVDLNQTAKDSLGKADSAMQSFNAEGESNYIKVSAATIKGGETLTVSADTYVKDAADNALRSISIDTKTDTGAYVSTGDKTGATGKVKTQAVKLNITEAEVAATTADTKLVTAKSLAATRKAIEGEITQIGSDYVKIGADRGLISKPVYVTEGGDTAAITSLDLGSGDITGGAISGSTLNSTGSVTVGNKLTVTTGGIMAEGQTVTAASFTGKATTAGTADEAKKLTCGTKGSLSKPVYFNNGTPAAITSLNLDSGAITGGAIKGSSLESTGTLKVTGESTFTGKVTANADLHIGGTGGARLAIMGSDTGDAKLEISTPVSSTKFIGALDGNAKTATTAETANQTKAALTIKPLTTDGVLGSAVNFNGSTEVALEAITFTEIEGIFAGK